MDHHQESTSPEHLFGDISANPIGIQPGIGDLIVSKSGQSVLFTPRDSQGNPQMVTEVRSSDDVQLLQLIGTTQATTCTLTFNGTTTAPIPLQQIPPFTSFLYQATLPHPGSYDLGLAWGAFYGGPAGVRGSTASLVEVFSGGVKLGSATLDQSQTPDASTGDIPVPKVGVFRPVGTFNFTGTDLLVRLTGEPGLGLLLAGAVRVAPTGSADPTAVGFIDPDPYRAPGSDGALEGVASRNAYGAWARTSFYTPVGLSHEGYFALPTGSANARFLAVADVQQALSSLSNVLPGSLNVSSPTNESILVRFSGPMGNQYWPTLACSEPMIQVVHDGTGGSSIGGDCPAVTINGVSHAMQASSITPGKSRMAFHLIQDAPTTQYQRYGEGLFQALNYNYFPVQDGIGYGGRVGYATQSGPLAIWQFQGIAGPADFEVAVTWPGGDAGGDLLQCAIQDGNGQVLATVSGIDQSKAPADEVDAAGVGWKSLGRVTLPRQVNGLVVQATGPGTAGKHIILDTIRLTRVSPDRGARIRPGDVVTFHMPPDYVRTTSGSVASVTGVPVTPAPATRLPAIPQVPKSLRLGYNCDPPCNFSIDSCFSNLAIQAQHPFSVAQDAKGNPTRLSGDPATGTGSNTSFISVYIGDANGRGYGVPASSPGVWVLQWTSSAASSCALDSLPPFTTVTEITSRRTTNGQVNRRYYQVSTTNPSSPNLLLRFMGTKPNGDGTYQCDVSNVAVYPPDVNPDSPGRWRPGFLKKLKGVQCFRFMEMWATNNMNLSEFSHLPDQSRFPLGYGGRSISIPIASIGPPTPDPFSESVAGTVVRVTTKVPHGLSTGFLVGLQTTDGTSIGQVQGGVTSPTDGSITPRDPIDPTDIPPYQLKRNMCRVIDDVTVQIGIQVYSGPLARMTNTLTPANGVLYADVAAAMMGTDDIADLCIDAGLEPWVSIPWLATDDFVAQVAKALGARLPAGRMVHVEYGNEPWNGGFIGNEFCVRMAKLLGLDSTSYVAYYMTRMGQVHRIFHDTWAALGRNPAEVRRVCGVWQNSAAASTAPCLDFAVANGIAFEELAPACYFSNTPAAGPLDDLLTRDQLLDLFAMNVQQSDIPGQMAAHTQACSDALAKYPTATWLKNVVLVNYEGGGEVMTTSTMTANLADRNHAVHRHPDYCEIEMNHLQMLEDAGVKLFNYYSLYGMRSFYQWGAYEGYPMEAGTGDATVDLANVNDYNNLSAIKSEAAAALMKWSPLIQQTQPIDTTGTLNSGQTTKPSRPVLRNGLSLSYGRPAY